MPESAYRLAAHFWPGPLTMVLPARPCVPKTTTGGLDTVAVRCPNHPVTLEIIRLAGVPIAAPSANRSGKPSTTTAQHVLDDHDGHIEAVVDGGPCQVGVESTIIDLTAQPPCLLRPGGISLEELRQVLGEITIDPAVTGQIARRRRGESARHEIPALCPPGPRPDCGRPRAGCRRLHQGPVPTGDRVLCFQEELPLYDGCAPLAYGKAGDDATLSAGLFSACGFWIPPRCAGFLPAAPRRRTGLRRAQPPAESRRVPHRGGRAMTVIGITGGSGSGKTTALEAAALGGLILDCRRHLSHLLQADPALLQAIEARVSRLRGGRLPAAQEAGPAGLF